MSISQSSNQLIYKQTTSIRIVFVFQGSSPTTPETDPEIKLGTQPGTELVTKPGTKPEIGPGTETVFEPVEHKGNFHAIINFFQTNINHFQSRMKRDRHT